MASEKKHTLGNVLFSIVKIIALLLLVIYFAVWLSSPLFARYFLAKALADYDVQISGKSHIRYNPFLTHIDIRNLELSKNSQPVFLLKYAQIELDLYRLLLKNIHVKTLEIEGFATDLQWSGKNIEVAGMVIPPADPEPEPAEQTKQDFPYTVTIPQSFLGAGKLNITHGEISHPLFIKQLRANDVNITPAKQTFNLILDMNIAGGKTRSTTSFNLSDKESRMTSDLNIENLQLGRLQEALKEVLRDINGELSLKTRAAITLSGDDLTVNAKNSRVQLSEASATHDEFRIDIGQHVVDAAQLSLRIHQGNVTEINAVGDSDLENASIKHTTSNDTLLRFAKMNAKKISLASQARLAESLTVNIEEISIGDATASKVARPNREAPSLLEVKKILATHFAYTQDALHLNTVDVDSLTSHVAMDADKNITTLVNLNQNGNNKTHGNNMEIAENENTPGFNLAVNEVRLTGANVITFVDRSITPHYERVFFIDLFNISKVNNDSSTPSPFQLIGRSNEYAKFDLTGKITPFAVEENTALKGRVEEISLPAISSYIKDSLGFELKSGQLDVDVDTTVVASELDGKIKLQMRGVNMRAANEDTSTRLKGQAAIPLNVALGMLKDKKGDITLKVPMHGSVKDPSFGVSSFLVLVTKKAIVSQTKSYLMKTFVPYANVISVAVAAGEFALKLRFENLTYDVAQVEIAETHHGYADQFVQLMKDRPTVQVKVCGIATPADIGKSISAEVASAEELTALNAIALRRSENFKRYAVDKGSLNSSRILLCNPQVDFSEKSRPRIELSI